MGLSLYKVLFFFFKTVKKKFIDLEYKEYSTREYKVLERNF